MAAAGNRIEIQHTALVLCQEAFGYCIYAHKQLYHPEKAVPHIGIGLPHGQVKYKYGGCHVQQYTIKTVLLAYLQQQVFFKQGNDVLCGFNNNWFATKVNSLSLIRLILFTTQ